MKFQVYLLRTFGVMATDSNNVYYSSNTEIYHITQLIDHKLQKQQAMELGPVFHMP